MSRSSQGGARSGRSASNPSKSVLFLVLGRRLLAEGKSQLGVIKNRKGSLVFEKAGTKHEKGHEHQKQSPKHSFKKKKVKR